MLPTGDLRGNVQRVIDHLKLVSYHLPVSSRSLKAGETTSLLPILHYTLLDFSPHVASFVSSHGYDLYGRDDATFTTAVFRLATLHLGIQPGLQAQQFLSRGFIGEQQAQALRSPFSGGCSSGAVGGTLLVEVTVCCQCPSLSLTRQPSPLFITLPSPLFFLFHVHLKPHTRSHDLRAQAVVCCECDACMPG